MVSVYSRVTSSRSAASSAPILRHASPIACPDCPLAIGKQRGRLLPRRFVAGDRHHIGVGLPKLFGEGLG